MAIRHKTKRVLLGQLGSFGDCLYATTVAHQIKTDCPECHLTWAIGSPYRPILDNNPHVDDVWEIPMSNREDLLTKWQQFEEEALRRKRDGDFDEVFLTQVFPGNLKNFDGTLRSSIFRAYPNPITVPVAPVVRLTNVEVDNVIRFADSHHLEGYADVILIECSPKSDQSFVNTQFFEEVAQTLVNSKKDVSVILSSNEPFRSNCRQIIDGSVLSFRENLKLIDYCSLIVGCSSGISWLATSSSAKKIPMIQLLEKRTFMFASLVHDFKFQGLETEHIMEMTNCAPQRVVDAILMIFASGFDMSKENYGKQIPVRFYTYWRIMKGLLLNRQFADVSKSVSVTLRRWGYRASFLLGFIAVFFGRYPKALYGVFRKNYSDG